MSQEVVGISPEGFKNSLLAEKAAHATSISVSSFVPYLGMVLKGDHSRSTFDIPDAHMLYANQALALMKVKEAADVQYQASAQDAKTDYTRLGYKSERTVALEFTAGLKKQLYLEKQQRLAQKNFMLNAGQIGNMSPMIAAQMQQAQNPYQGSVPPGGSDVASNVVGPLTQIPFIQDVLGFPNPEYHINGLTTKVALPQLHAEQPETDWGTPNLQMEATDFVENRRPDFDSHFFLAKRNEFAFFIPREYRYRATIDPYNIYVRQASDGLRQAREALTLLELSSLPDQNKGGFEISTEDIPDPTVDIVQGFPAAKNNVKSFLEGLFSKFWEKTRGQIDSIVMNPVDFVNYESNFYTQGFQGYNDVSDWGVLQMPGFKRRIKVASSPFCPRNEIYFFNSRFVFTGEGPMVTESWAKPEANSDAGAYRDYVDVRIFNKFRAGFKGKIEGTNPTEITTLQEARDLIKPPANLLEKNQ